MKNYGPYHDHIEQLLVSTKPLSDPAELLKVKASIEAEFAEVGADPYSPGASENERIAREEEVDRISRQYPTESDTGFPHPENLYIKDSARVTALLSGTDAIVAAPTVCNAFKLYVSEINQPDLRKRKSQIYRVRRIEGELLRITGQDLPFSKVQRAHARKLRDNLKSHKTSKSRDASSVKNSSVKRNLGSGLIEFQSQ